MQKTISAGEQIVQRANRAPYIYYILFALFLTAFILHTRIRYQAQYLYSWDSISFALSIERFDMRRHQPHPPGYPLYSYTIRLLDHFVSDPNRSMIYLNIASTLGACWFIAKLVYLFTKNRIAAGGAALLYAANPVSWFYGTVAEIYATEGFWVSLIAYLVLVSHDRRRYLIWASAAMAIAGGFRPTTEVFLLPFYATGYFRKNYSIVLQALSILVIGNLLWLWPLISSAGGFPAYVDAVLGQSRRAAEISGEGTAERMTFAKASVRIVQTITFPVLIALFLRLKKIKLSWKESSLLLAVLPPLVVFTIIHFPKDGYLLLVIPFIIAFAVLLLNKAIASPGKLTAVIALGCLISIIGFVRPVPAGRIVDEWTRPNQQIVAQRMQRLKRFFTVVDGLGGGQHKTFVLENRHYFPNWRMLLYYYPDHTIYLVWPNKRRAYVAGDHEYRTVQPPLPMHSQSTLITVGRTPPAFSTQSFHVEAFRYYFVEPGTLPRNFQLYSMAFVVQANE